jgi:hypothetical protein
VSGRHEAVKLFDTETNAKIVTLAFAAVEKCSLFWDLTERSVVVTDVSGQPIGRILTLSLLMSYIYIYGALCKARNFNVVYD